MIKNLALFALLNCSAISLSKRSSNQSKLDTMMRDSDDSLWERSAEDNKKQMDQFSSKLAEQSKDMPSAPLFTEEKRMPVLGQFKPTISSQGVSVEDLENSCLARHQREDPKSPLVVMALVGASRSTDKDSVNNVLQTSENDAVEEAAIKKIAQKVQTDEEVDQSVN